MSDDLKFQIDPDETLTQFAERFVNQFGHHAPLALVLLDMVMQLLHGKKGPANVTLWAHARGQYTVADVLEWTQQHAKASETVEKLPGFGMLTKGLPSVDSDS